MNYDRLKEWALEEVESVQNSLPEELQEPMLQCEISYETRANGADGEPIFGRFEGRALHDDATSATNPKICLFLENLWDFSDHDEEMFRDEVGATIFHEMGLFMGWEEQDEPDEDL